jgi:hypothetical protein
MPGIRGENEKLNLLSNNMPSNKPALCTTLEKSLWQIKELGVPFRMN